MTRSKTGWVFLALAFILALAGVTPAIYAHGGDATLIHACVNKNSGAVKIVDANASCKKNETALDWPSTVSPSTGSSIMNHGVGVTAPFPPEPTCVPAAGANCDYRLPRDGTITNMRILINSNSFNGPAVVTLFVNGIRSELSTTIPPGSTTDIDVPGAVTALDGDRIAVRIDGTAVSSGLMQLTISYEIL
jgi:hypothetical protein